MKTTKGIDLAIERMRAGVTQKVLSYHLRVSRARIGTAEHQATVTPAFAARYREALREAKRQA